MLIGWLDFHRATLALKCDGLDAQQLARRAVPPSALSLLGLLRHMGEVEQIWFDRMAGCIRTTPYSDDDHPDRDFDDAIADDACVAEALAYWQEQVEVARAVTAATRLDDVFPCGRHGELSARWVLVHMIEEYARHNGHADLLRELIDGTTGE
jgi:uncharacterized damage-inducible protein DinB